jgi:hypothetical protein
MAGLRAAELGVIDWAVANATMEEVFIRITQQMNIKAAESTAAVANDTNAVAANLPFSHLLDGWHWLSSRSRGLISLDCQSALYKSSEVSVHVGRAGNTRTIELGPAAAALAVTSVLFVAQGCAVSAQRQVWATWCRWLQSLHMVVMNVASAGVLLIQSFHWLLVDGLAIEMDVGYVPLVAGCSVL